MNIILVVDNLDWAFGKVAQNIKKRMQSSNVEILCTSHYKTIKDFLDALKKATKKDSIIHFFWRDYLLECLNFVRLFPKYKNIFLNNKITTHIPDHLFIETNSDDYEKRVGLMKFVDGYFVTSKKLYDLYAQDHTFDAPFGIIYDNPDIKIQSEYIAEAKGKIKVVWIGNSRWGEYLGHLDYKGLNSVVLPALKKIENSGRELIYKEFDSSKKKNTHEVILDYLKDADILLVSSLAEGTPLPLLEAMAQGCAIITSDVGIASEILSEEQQEFIVPRNSDAFTEALIKLDTNRSLLENIKRTNKLTYIKKFVESDEIALQWKTFFECVREKNNLTYKSEFLKQKKTGFSERLLSIALYRASQFAIKTNMIEILKKNKIVRELYYKAIGQLSNDNSYSELEIFYTESISGQKIIALYSPYWSGVATSTASFFKESSLPFPYYKTEFPQVNEHNFLERLSELLAESSELKAVIMSGGTMLQMQLAKMLKQKNKSIKIFFGWHGSPAQWVDSAQYKTFDDWLSLYKENTINGVVSFKPQLSNTLEQFDIKSYSVSNYIIEPSVLNTLSAPTKEHYTIGLFAAMFSWYKNPFPQLLAIGSIPGCELVTNLTLDQDIKWVTEQIKLIELNGHLNNKKFVELLSNLHVVSYVTNTECSPMIALESVSVGTPCIVGPAGNIYKGNAKLEHYLVEPEVDNPTAIRNRLILVRDNYQEVKSLLNAFAESYNANLDEVKRELYKELTQ